LNNPHPKDDLVQLGKIIGAHGIRGAVKIYSYAESAESFTTQHSVIVQDPAGRQATYTLLECRPHKQILRVTLKNVTTRNQAEALMGCGVYVTKKSLPQLNEDTYYWSDLIGMTVMDTEGNDLGRLSQIIQTGANDVYVVTSTDHQGPAEILVPAIEQVIIDIDVDRKQMVVELPEGLI
jgi:16S rRNA processing protein RimM